MNAINNNNSLLDALSIQTAGHLTNSNNVASKLQPNQTSSNNNLFNSLTGNQHDLLGQQLNNNLLSNLFGQAFNSTPSTDNGTSNDNLKDLIRSNKMISNQLALANLIKNNSGGGGSKNLQQTQQFDQLTRNLNGLNQNKSSNQTPNSSTTNNLLGNNLLGNNLNSNLNSNLLNTIQQQQLMAAFNLNNNLNNLNLNNLNNLNLNNLNSLNLGNSIQNFILQNAMQQITPLDFSSNSTKKNSSSSTLNLANKTKANANALDLSQVKRHADSELEELDEKDEEHTMLLKRINQLNQLNNLNPLLLNQQLLLTNLKSNEDAMSVDDDCFDSEDKLSNHLNNNSKKSKNMNKVSSNKSLNSTFNNNNNNSHSLNKNNNNNVLMDCDLGGQAVATKDLVNGTLRKQLQKQTASSKEDSSTKEICKDDQLSGLSKEELEMLVRKQLNNNTLTSDGGQFDHNAELTNALRNIIPSHLLDKQKMDATSIFEKLLLQNQQQLNNNNLHQQISSNDNDKNLARNHRNQLRRHMDHNANETATTIVANAAK